MKTLTKEKYKFPCGRWLDTNEDDNEVVRELPAMGDSIAEPLPGMSMHLHSPRPAALQNIIRSNLMALCYPSAVIKYRVTVCTGTVGGSGTDASVFLNLIGDQGDTGNRQLVNCKNNVNKFEKGNVGAFCSSLLDIQLSEISQSLYSPSSYASHDKRFFYPGLCVESKSGACCFW